MKRNRKIIVQIAASADGYIARSDGKVDWLDGPRPAGNYGMGAFVRSINTILWGRRTYDEALQRGYVGGGFGAKIKDFVISHRPPDQASKSKVEFVNQPIAEFAKRLRSQPGKDIWIMGGGGLIGSFLDANEIDEFIIALTPVFIGEGIRLIEQRQRTVPLKLVKSQRYANGVVQLHYQITPPARTS